MTKKKRQFFFDDFFNEIDKIFERMIKSMGFEDISEFGGGSWSIQITQGPDGKTTIYAEIGPDVDRDKFIDYLKRRYPNAKIIVKGGKSRKKSEKIRIIKLESEEESQVMRKKERIYKLFKEEKPESNELFEVIKVEKEEKNK